MAFATEPASDELMATLSAMSQEEQATLIQTAMAIPRSVAPSSASIDPKQQSILADLITRTDAKLEAARETEAQVQAEEDKQIALEAKIKQQLMELIQRKMHIQAANANLDAAEATTSVEEELQRKKQALLDQEEKQQRDKQERATMVKSAQDKMVAKERALLQDASERQQKVKQIHEIRLLQVKQEVIALRSKLTAH